MDTTRAGIHCKQHDNEHNISTQTQYVIRSIHLHSLLLLLQLSQETVNRGHGELSTTCTQTTREHERHTRGRNDRTIGGTKKIIFVKMT